MSTEPGTTRMANLMEDARADAVTDLEALDGIYGQPQRTSIDKVTSALTPLMIDFLNASAMHFLATADAEGRCDVSPRGDPAGEILIADPRTLVLPDRRGNKRVDSLRNLAVNDTVGLLFLVLGSDDTLRVNGRATLSRHAPLLETLAMRGVAPDLAVIVDIDEAYMHCPRAFRRSGFWEPATWPAKDSYPNMSAIMHAQFQPEQSLEAFARERDERASRTLYRD